MSQKPFDAKSIALKPGVQFAANPDGTAVIWDIRETIRKFYVLHESGHEDRYY
jgi:uncharacterized cupin superfamily protein